MPTSPKKPCAHPGCPALTDIGSYCTTHQRTAPNARRTYDQTTRKQTPELAEAARIRSSSRWQVVRTTQRSLNPLCCDPFKRHPVGALTQQMHHVCSLVKRPDLAFDPRNLAPSCEPCHADVEAMERTGQQTAHLFNGIEINTPFGIEKLYGDQPPALYINL